jgi:microcystin-dependent protein
LNNASNVFTGNGAALTALNATQLTTGTVPQARVVPNMQRFVFTTGAEARPTGTSYVEWIGPVQPTNATVDDTWTDTSSQVIEDPVIGMPIGTIQMFASSTAPTNWFSCTGQAISRTIYSVLFALIGTTYGAGDGTTTFNLPNFQGRGPMGFMPGNTKFDTMGETGGEESHVQTLAELAAHNHGGATGNGGAHTPTAQGVNTGAATTGQFGAYPIHIQNDVAPNWGVTNFGAVPDHTHPINSAGSSAAMNVLDPYLTVNFIIKVL